MEVGGRAGPGFRISNTEGHDDFVISSNVHHPIKLLFQTSISFNLKETKNDSKCISE